ncbi:DUF928 domain-containing protein [Coleofasciculus sp. G2-EDA-02]|uniref:DUF928 domain-containing protein n=1 Tax=Coleofasciculus sp. G2-EDA-02 TaxID=3069529 RepID=UPI0032FD78E7
MNIFKWMLIHHSKPLLAIGIILSLITTLSPATAQVEPSHAIFEPISIPSLLPNLPGNGTPTSKNGTGTRGDCFYQDGDRLLTRMVGSKNFQLTVSEYPTFLVYVPYGSDKVSSGEFSIQYGEDDIYRTTFKVPETPGIFSVTVPTTEKPLEIGKTYRWYFEISCSRSAQSEQAATRLAPASLTGFVRRVAQSPELEAELNRAKNPLERVAAYAKHDIWYNMLTELAQLRLEYPENATLESIWLELLGDERIGLQEIEQEPIAGSVIPGNVITSSQPE